MGKKNLFQALTIRKGRYAQQYRGKSCLNCGQLLEPSDSYCPHCSQVNSTKKLSVWDFFEEFLSNTFNYDSKLPKTLYALLLKPGTITKDYIDGKRISYTNPFRFLLSLAFIYFLVFSFGSDLSRLNDLDLEDRIENAEAFDFDTSNPEEFAKNSAIQDALKNKGENVIQVSGQDSLLGANPKAFYATIGEKRNINTLFKKMEFFTTLLKKDSITTFEDAKNKYGVPEHEGNRRAYNFSNSVVKTLKEPGSFLNDLISKLPLVVFFFLPVFALFILLVYIRKKHTYTDHLIFSFHNQALMFILLLLSLLIDKVFGTSSGILFLFIYGFYLYKAMRNFYKQGRVKTILKFIFLSTVFSFLAILAMTLVFTGSVFTY